MWRIACAGPSYSPFRRAETLVSPDVLQQLMPGYGHSREAAEAMLNFLSEAGELPLYRAVGNLLTEISLTERKPFFERMIDR